MEQADNISTHPAKDGAGPHKLLARGRGANVNMASRFEKFETEPIDDGWDNLQAASQVKTTVSEEIARSIITKNNSPDISFSRSINPYRGCEHGCTYCFARPSHAYMGLSPGLDFETRLFAKINAAQLLETELRHKNYTPDIIALGANTDPYQPVERDYRITRSILEVLDHFNHPVAIVTKSSLITRDLDILSSMAARGLVKVALSITTLNPTLSRLMEPRAATPALRLKTLEMLNGAGIPTTVMVAPVIPGLTDNEIEHILGACANRGVLEAGYILLRMPIEVRDVFVTWLETHFPDRAKKVLSLIRATRGGKDNSSVWGERMSGTGHYAWTLGRRFQLACTRLDLNIERTKLGTDLFAPPPQSGDQLDLFKEFA